MTGWDELALAIGLMLVIEGLLPFISPSSWRQAISTALQLSDRQLRLLGFGSMLLGVLLIQWLKH